MAPRTRRGTGVRAILAGGLIALVSAAVIPASAAAPQLAGTTVDTGWNGRILIDEGTNFDNKYDAATASALKARVGNDLIAANFSLFLDPANSGAVVRDSNAVVVPGFVLVQNKGVSWIADEPLAQDGSEYTVEFSATASGPSGTAMTPVTKTFKVDRLLPKPPVISSMSAQISASQGMRDALNESGVLPGFDVNVSVTGSGPIEGRASDNSPFTNGDTVATSGIKSIKLRFFDLAGDLAMTLTVDNTCAAGQCPESFDPWSSDLAGLEAGIWTLKASSVDLAGLESSPTRPLTFVHSG